MLAGSVAGLCLAVVCLLSGGRPGYLLREYSHGDQIRPLRRRRARDLYPLAASLRLRCRGPFRAGRFPPESRSDVAFFASRRRLHAADAGQRRKSAGVRSRRPDARDTRNGTGGPHALGRIPRCRRIVLGRVPHACGRIATADVYDLHEQYPLPPACQGHVAQYAGRCRSVPVWKSGRFPWGYSLCPDRCHTVGDKLIPAGNGKLATHVERTPLKAQELRGEFVTMRYTAEHIPVFRLWFGDKAVTEPIDLRRAFRTWGLESRRCGRPGIPHPAHAFADGSVEVRPWIAADVEDWQDGGTFNFDRGG